MEIVVDKSGRLLDVTTPDVRSRFAREEVLPALQELRRRRDLKPGIFT